MRILHISNFVQRHKGRLFWNHAFKISNGFIRNGHSVYNFSDRDVSKLSLTNKFNNEKNTNNDLISTFKNYNPDLLVIGHADKIHNTTILKLKKMNPNLKIIEWNVDNYLLDNTENKLKNRSEAVDHIFITNGDERISSAAINNTSVSFFPNIFDSSIEDKKIFENKTYDKDLFFALSHGVGRAILKKNMSKKSNNASLFRENIIHLVEEKLPKLRTNFFGIDDIQPVWGADFEKELSRCPMSLNLSRAPHLKYYSSDRIAQYLGNGSAIFIDYKSKLNDLFKEDEAIFYDNDDELIEKIDYFSKKTNEVKNIALKGWNRGHNNYNEKIITNYMIYKSFNKDIEISWPEVSFS
tara:strand:- start:174 stop:1232 length:1059 start_codon:yes stop_codon:yes gene_type:complete